MRHSSKEIQTALEAAQEEYAESEVIVKWLGTAQAVDVLRDVLEEHPTWDVTQAIRHVIDSASEEDFTEDLHRWGMNGAGTVRAPLRNHNVTLTSPPFLSKKGNPGHNTGELEKDERQPASDDEVRSMVKSLSVAPDRQDPLKQRIRQKIESFKPKGINQEEFLDRIRWALEHWTAEELPEHIMGNIDIYNRHVGRGGRMGTLFKELEGILQGRENEADEHIDYIARESKDRVPAPRSGEPYLSRSIDPGLYRWWKEFVQYQGGRGYLTRYDFEEGSTLTTADGDWSHFRKWLNTPRTGAPPAREVIDYVEFLAPYDSTTYPAFEREFLSRGYVKGHLWELVKTLADEQMVGLEEIQRTWYISRISKCTVCGLQTEGELKHEGRVICKACLKRKGPVEYDEFRSAVQEKLVPGARQLEFAVTPEPMKPPKRRKGPPPKTAIETDLSRWGEMPGKPRIETFRKKEGGNPGRENPRLLEARKAVLRLKGVRFEYYPPRPDGHCRWVCLECDPAKYFTNFPAFQKHLESRHGIETFKRREEDTEE